MNISERYTSAVNSSDLRMQTRDGVPATDIDVCTAAGMAKRNLGTALLRLAAEYSTPAGLREGRAVSDTDKQLVRLQLRTLGHVVELLTPMAERLGNAEMARPVVLWWVDKVCGACKGRGYPTIGDGAKLSPKVCKACSGTGEAKIPFARQGGEVLADHLEWCVHSAKQGIAMRIR